MHNFFNLWVYLLKVVSSEHNQVSSLRLDALWCVRVVACHVLELLLLHPTRNQIFLSQSCFACCSLEEGVGDSTAKGGALDADL